MLRAFLFILILFFAAAPAFAGVVINEVAWMGTANSAQDEWIELYSDGSQNLDGWTLLTIDGGMSINLSGTINGYYLVERTDDITVPNIAADLIAVFGSGLSNSGEILILKNASGAEVARVDGSNNWAIGGNNTTKETLQKTSVGWTTAMATPKAQNADAPLHSEENNSSETSSSSSSQSGGVIEMADSVSKIKASAGADRTVLAGAEAVFNGSAEGFVDATADKIRFYWNFGDGKTLDGNKVAHIFLFPGIYEVLLTASFAGVSVSDSAKITAIENPVIISEIKPGQWVEIYNNSSSKIDFSNFGIGIGDAKPFYFPENTFLAPYAHIALGDDVLGFEIPQSGAVKILYPNGKILFSSAYPVFALGEKESLNFAEDGWIKSKATPGAKNEVVKISSAPSVSAVSRTQTKIEQLSVGAGEKVAEEINLASASSVSEYIWLFSGLGFGILGGLALFFAKRYRA